MALIVRSQKNVLIGAPAILTSLLPIRKYAKTIFIIAPAVIDHIGIPARPYDCSMALPTVTRQDNVTERDNIESKGAEIAIACSSPENTNDSICGENRQRPNDIGIATVQVSFTASPIALRCAPSFPAPIAADRVGTSGNATEDISDGATLKSGTASVV